MLGAGETRGVSRADDLRALAFQVAERRAARQRESVALLERLGALRRSSAALLNHHPRHAHEEVMRPNNSGLWNGVGRMRVSGVAAVDDTNKISRAERVGRNIRLARKRAGLSQQQLADAIERDRRQVSDWERGVHEAWDDSLNLLAGPLKVQPWWFLIPHDELEGDA